MFFSWVAYKDISKDPTCLVNLEYSETTGHGRLKGFGTWKITGQYVTNEMLEHAHAIVAECEQQKQIIVAFRGTELDFANRFKSSMHDWIYGCFNAALIDWEVGKGRCHSGFFVHYKSVAKQILDQVLSYADRGYTVYFTGHSQGSALATMAMLELHELSPQTSSYLYTFGSPNVGDKRFVSYFESKVNTKRVFHYITSYPSPITICDMVTTVPDIHFGYCKVPGVIKYIKTNSRFFGNPNPITGIEYQGPSLVPKFIGSHYQQSYMDALIEGCIGHVPFHETIQEFTQRKKEELQEMQRHNSDILLNLHKNLSDSFWKMSEHSWHNFGKWSKGSKHSIAMEQMIDAGYTDQDANAKALEKVNGDVMAAINIRNNEAMQRNV